MVTKANSHWRDCQGKLPPRMPVAERKAAQREAACRQEGTSATLRALAKFSAWRAALKPCDAKYACDPNLDFPFVNVTSAGSIKEYVCRKCSTKRPLCLVRRVPCLTKPSVAQGGPTVAQWQRSVCGKAQIDTVAAQKGGKRGREKQKLWRKTEAGRLYFCDKVKKSYHKNIIKKRREARNSYHANSSLIQARRRYLEDCSRKGCAPLAHSAWMKSKKHRLLPKKGRAASGGRTSAR